MRKEDSAAKSLIAVGWREWVAFPDLGITHIKAKIDTGARTSALHAFALEPFLERGAMRVEFRIHPIQRNRSKVKTCVADVIDRRVIRDSGGHSERRYVIQTDLILGPLRFPIEISLTSRDTMAFRLLLGRTALRKVVSIDPSASFLLGNHKPC